MNEEFISKVKDKMGEEEFEAMSEPINHGMLAAAYKDNKILETYNFMPEQFRNAVSFKEYWEFYREELGLEDEDGNVEE